MAGGGSAARVTPRSWAMKKAAWIGVSVMGLLAAIILVVPAWVDLGMFKSAYLPFIEETLHRRVDVAEVRLALVPAPSIRISNLRVSDGPAFPDNTFFSAGQVQLRLKFWPLLRGRFEVSQFVLEKPVMNLLKQPDGSFNYADLADKKLPLAKKPERSSKNPAAKSQEAVALPLVLPSRMSISDGQLNLETKGQKPLSINGIDLSLENFAGGQPFPYRASFRYPGLKTVSLEGMLSYREEQASLVLKNNRLKLQDLDLPIEGSVTQVTTAPRLNLTVAGDAIDAKSVWQILSVFGLTPRDMEVAGLMGLRIKLTGPSSSPVTEVRGLFKNVKVAGKRALKGKLTGEVFIQLPMGGGSMTRRLQGNGKVVVSDGALTNGDWIRKAQQMTAMIGLSKEQGREATTFKTLETDFTVADGLANFNRIHMVNPQLEADGAGTMTLQEPALNLAIESVLSAQTSTRSRTARAATFFKDSRNRMVVPLKITGPVANPTVNLDAEKLAQKGMGRPLEKNLDSLLKQKFRR